MTNHHHDFGTLIYGQCAYCPLTVADMLESHQRLNDQLFKYEEASYNMFQPHSCGQGVEQTEPCQACEGTKALIGLIQEAEERRPR